MRALHLRAGQGYSWRWKVSVMTFRVTKAVCPLCEKMVKTSNGIVFDEHGPKKKRCPESGKPFPSIKPIWSRQ